MDCFASLAMTLIGRHMPDTPASVAYDARLEPRKILSASSAIEVSLTPM
jgi:hypothetical protein